MNQKESKNKVGRKTVMTEDLINKLEEVFAIGGTDAEACFYAGISHQTLYDYQNKHPEFIERKEALKEKPILKARKTVVESLENPDYAFKYLEKKRKDEFGNNASIEIRNMTELEKHKESLRLLLEEAEKEIDESTDTENTNEEVGKNS